MSIKTVVELDLVGYSDVARVLEENLDAEVVARFDAQIQEFVDAGLKLTGAERAQVVLATTGDGAILAFDRSEDAHRFAVGVHSATQEHNSNRRIPSAQRWFRIGMATGDLYQGPPGLGQHVAGTVIAAAVRLENAARPGEIIADETTFDYLPAELQVLYRGEETIAGKRDERFPARRCTVVPYTVDVRTKRKPPTSLDQRNRLQMLKRVRLDWIDGVLKQSLYQVARLELRLEPAEDAIEEPLNALVQVPDRSPMAVPAGIRVGRIFDDLGQALLILGAPGTGKTTLLLELAQELLASAEQDESDPIPVVFNLSSWAVRPQPLDRWLIAELNERSDVPKRQAKQWVESEQIIPLLDGLDEVAEEYRQACVEVINDFRRDHGFVPIAICSRIADYEALSTKLRLRNAVLIQILTKVQVEDCLQRAGGPMSGLQAALQQDASLWELLETPLMLWVAMLAYNGFDQRHVCVSGTLKTRHQDLFSTYVDAMFRRRSSKSRFTREQTLRWLTWLAFSMARRDQSVFHLEELNRKWLTARNQRAFLRFFVGVVHGLIVGLMLALTSGVTAGLIVGLLSGVATMVTRKVGRGRPADIIGWSWLAAKNNLIAGLTATVAAGFFFGGLTGLAVGPTIGSFGLAVGLILGPLVGFQVVLAKGFIVQEISTRETPNQGTWRTGRNALIFGLVLGLSAGVGSGLLFGLLFGLRGLEWGLGWGFNVGVVYALANGGHFFVRHWGMRLLLPIYGYAPLRYNQFLDHATERVFLRKLGGGYIFVHRMLLEYFASMARPAYGDDALSIAPPHVSTAALNLERVLGFWSAISIVAGTVVVVGVFLVPSIMVRYVGSVKELFLVWIVGGLISLFGAMTYAELAAALPEAGGEYVYLRAAYGPFWAFLYGWTQLWVAKSGVIATLAAAFSTYLSAFFPILASPIIVVPLFLGRGGSFLQIHYGQLLGIVVILSLAGLNYIGVRSSGNLQVCVTAVKFALILGMGAAGIFSGRGDFSHFHSHVTSVGGTTGFLSALVIALWSYEGWNNVTMISSEIEKPHRNLPRSLILGMMAVIATYILVNVSYFYILNPGEVASTRAVAADMVALLYGNVARGAVTFAALISIFAALNGSILSGSRVLYAMARERFSNGNGFRTRRSSVDSWNAGVDLGYLTWAARVQRRYRTPGNSILLLCLWSCVVLLSGWFDDLVNFAMFGSWVLYLMTAVSLLVLRRKRPDLERPYRVPGYPVIPLLFTGAAFLLLVNALQTRPRESVMGLGLIALGVPFYFCRKWAQLHKDERDDDFDDW